MRWFYALAIIAAAFCVVYGGRQCHTIHVESNSLQRIIANYRDRIDSLKEINDELLLNREVKYVEVIKMKEKRVYDTAIIRHYDTACPDLVKENRMLWEIVTDDSLIIGNQGQVIRLQDSVIEKQQQQMDGMEQRHKAEMKAQKKALRIARLLNYGLGAALTLSLVR